MYINSTGYYIPAERVPNEHFLNLNGLTSEWILQRTGIRTRSKAGEGEGHNSMGLAAIRDAIKTLPYDIKDVDLIVSAAYSPYDTVATLAHIAQREFNMEKAKAVYASSACSSFVNGLEIIEGYFAMNKATKALIVCSEHNTYYANETDKVCGHLWGDAAVAFFVSKERVSALSLPVRPRAENALSILTEENGMKVANLDYIICHQANMRIVANVAHNLQMDDSKFLNNIEELGNTGSASSALVFAQNIDKFKKGQKIGLSVFGGGYSVGAFLVEI